MRILLAVVVLGLGAGCNVVTGFEGVFLSEARLRLADLTSVGMVGHRTTGKATLLGTDRDGDEVSTDVTFEGGGMGATMGGIVADGCGEIPLEISGADDDGDGLVAGGALFGLYDGSVVGLALLGGWERRNLQNENGVGLEFDTFAVGGFMVAGAEWVALSLDTGADAGEDVPDLDPPPPP